MTESQYQVISFDDVKEEYIKDLGLKSVPRSNDALLSLPDGSLVFVEFKNGYIDLKDQYDIRKKIFDLEKEGYKVFAPPMKYCTDNAAMVASCAYFNTNTFDDVNVEVFSRVK